MKNRFLLSLLFFLIVGTVGPAQAQEDQDPCAQKVDKIYEKEFKKARALQNKGEVQDARRIYCEILDEFPEYLEANYYYAMSYYYPIQRNGMMIDNMENARKALEAFQRIQAVCPAFKMSHNLYAARLAYRMENFPEALRFAETLLQNPDECALENLDEAEVIIKASRFYDKILNHPVPFDPLPVYGISTEKDEYLATVSPDGGQFYFTRRMPYSDPKNYFAERTSREFFCSSLRNENGNFDEGEPLPAPFNQSDNEGSPAINATNDYLVFSKMTPYKSASCGTYPNYDLYYSEYVDGEWTTPRSVGDKVNLPDYYESQPSLSSDGSTLFFTSDRPGGYGKNPKQTTLDIWFSTRNANGEWDAPVNLGPAINTPGNEKSPFLHTDSRTLYFSSDAHQGLGGFDIFYAKLNGKNQWDKPENIGYPINTESDEVDFFVSLDGQTAYFSSNNLGSEDWNIYQFDLYEEARPHTMILIKGEVVSDDGDLSGIVVEIRDSSSQVVATSKVNEHSGKYAIATEVEENKPVEIVLNVKKPGHSFDTKLITSDQLVDGVVQRDAEVKRVEVNKIYDLHDIHFATNRFDLSANSRRVIDLFIEFLTENPGIKAEIQGHTDNVGDDKANQILSEKRAKSVYDYVVEQGIAASRLRYKGYGEYSPVTSNDTEAGRAKNRRTVFLIFEK